VFQESSALERKLVFHFTKDLYLGGVPDGWMDRWGSRDSIGIRHV
jgi:hypothetical protein